MLTAEIIRGKNRCKCAQCVRCYEDAIAAQVEEQRQLEELRDEMNSAGLDLVQTIASQRRRSSSAAASGCPADRQRDEVAALEVTTAAPSSRSRSRQPGLGYLKGPGKAPFSPGRARSSAAFLIDHWRWICVESARGMCCEVDRGT